jgi:hypothetical protein
MSTRKQNTKRGSTAKPHIKKPEDVDPLHSQPVVINNNDAIEDEFLMAAMGKLPDRHNQQLRKTSSLESNILTDELSNMKLRSPILKRSSESVPVAPTEEDITELLIKDYEAEAMSRQFTHEENERIKREEEKQESDSDSDLESKRVKEKKAINKEDKMTVKLFKRRISQSEPRSFDIDAKVGEPHSPEVEQIDGKMRDGNNNNLAANQEDVNERIWRNNISQEEFQKNIIDKNIALVETQKLKNKTTRRRSNKTRGGSNGKMTEEEARVEKELDDIQLEDKKLPLPDQQLHYTVQSKGPVKLYNDSSMSTTGEFFGLLQDPSRTYRTNCSLVYKFLKNRMPKNIISTSRTLYTGKFQMSGLPMSRKSEELALKEHIPDVTRPCARGEECCGLKIPNVPKTLLREKLLPQEELDFVSNKVLPEKTRPCVMCWRDIIMEHWQKFKHKGDSVVGDWLATKYHNAIDAHGEYVLEQCICSTSKEYPAIPLPIVMHATWWYTYESIDGVGHFHQTGYIYPEQLEEARQRYKNQHPQHAQQQQQQQQSQQQRQSNGKKSQNQQDFH